MFRDEQGTWRNARREFGANLTFAIERIYEPFLAEIEAADRWLRDEDPTLAPIETGWLKEREPVGQARSVRKYRS